MTTETTTQQTITEEMINSMTPEEKEQLLARVHQSVSAARFEERKRISKRNQLTAQRDKVQKRIDDLQKQVDDFNAQIDALK